MGEDTKRILQMLADGKISVEEAERLMAALGEDKPAPEQSVELAEVPRKKPKYLRVVVDAQHGNGGNPAKVNIRVPMNLLRAGVRLSNLIPDQARDQVNAAMREHGVNLDLNQIKPENIEELIEQLGDLTIDVDDQHSKVRIFCE